MTLFIPVFLLISGCKKEEDPTPVVDPVIVASANPNNPEFNGDSEIRWKITGDFNSVSVLLDGIEFSNKVADTFLLKDIDRVRIFVFICNLKNGLSKRETVIITPKDEEIIIHQPVIMKAIVTPNHFPVGGGLGIIEWQTVYADSVLLSLDGKWYPADYSMEVFFINDTTKFTIKAKNENGTKDRTLLVTVEPEIIPDFHTLLQYSSWRNVNFYETCPEKNIWHQEVVLSECELDDLFIFSETKIIYDKGEYLCPGETTSISFFDYTLNDSIINGLGKPRCITLLNADSLIWRFEGSYVRDDGSIGSYEIEQIFIH